jgi:Na+-translocating ferredoxin:NAD+ oxidoreductase RNF subunit RnfB
VTLPSSVQSIGWCGFEGCTSLATIAVPKGCRLQEHAFPGGSLRVTRF